MASEDTSRAGWAFRLLFLALVVVPVVAPLVGSGADALPAVDLPAVDAATLIRAVGLGAAVLVVLLLVRQKRRTRGQRSKENASEHDRQVDGSGEVYAPYVYNSQQQARRESKQIQNRAEEIAEADREARKRR